MLKLRPAVKRWAERMEKELRLNEHKGGWSNSPVSFFLGRARANLREIKYGGFGMESGTDFIIKCLADCSNFCMMAADNLIPKKWDHKDRY
ncbi:unnamed protein product [marine sediment metagenome]|uniref:Uncharacterized protein n=1 Tax=marine sediment metagenome TaxID=412755 RepID=X1DD49_9ZZZZ